MKRIFRLTAIIAFLFISITTVQAQRRNARYNEYIKQYAPLAVEQMQRHKIPASITLAQGLLESGAGYSELARKSNNHFGIKCGGNWRGRTVRHDDDARNECFRAYRNPKDSYEDHSDFLKRGARYAFLFKLKITDYKGWARGLKKAGYATDPSYANRLITIIEDYELYKYDSRGMSKRDVVPNINLFMNVPIKPTGEMTIVDGISAPGDYVELKAEMDVLLVISNCPQINNPCNGFDPTPVRVLVWDGEDA